MKVRRFVLLTTVILVGLMLSGCITVGLIIADHHNKNYWKYAAPAGEIEKKYTAMGELEVSYKEFDAKTAAYGKYEIWYPTEMKDTDEKYPLVIMANGTGVRASKYQEVFKHLASWGFIVAGNEDDSSLSGASSAETLDFMLAQNDHSGSEFYGRIDVSNIGIAGHSQGGLGAVNAMTSQENGDRYKAMWIASATSPYWGQDDVFGAAWRVDMSKIAIPCLMVAGTGPADAGTATDISQTEGQGICPLWGLTESYNAIPNGTPKVMARLIGKDHGDMLRYADGYMTAWFMYYLKGDEYAGGAFFGENAEITANANWQDVKVGK